MKETPLAPLHKQWGGRMGEESGWRMPEQFHSLIEEHLAARAACGIFDISHIAKFSVTGNGAQDWLEGMLSNSVASCRDSHIQRTLMLDANGCILEKPTLLRESAGRFFLLGHAALAEEDFRWLSSHKPHGSIALADETTLWSAMALCGPGSEAVLGRVFPEVEAPMPMVFLRMDSRGDDVILARACLQGEEGFQLLCPAYRGISWFEVFVAAGAVPCGFATRENLRLACGASCCFKDIRGATPAEVSLGSLCCRDKTYIGSAAVLDAAANPPAKMLVALRCADTVEEAPAGTPVLDGEGGVIGHVTSSCIMPDDAALRAFAFLPAHCCIPGKHVHLSLAGTRTPAVILGPPVM